MPEESPDTKPALNMGYWIAIGAGMGVALGAALEHIAVGIAVGAGIGVAMGAAF